MERRINSLEGPPALRPINAQIASIKINNQPARVLFESIGKLAGINPTEVFKSFFTSVAEYAYLEPVSFTGWSTLLLTLRSMRSGRATSS